MDGELAPEFIYDQGLYYPAAGNYYGYVCTGMEPSSEWDDHHKFLGLDGQDPQFLGLQTENFPCVYYTPSYDYGQSPYNPFNPYIPGAVVGTDNPYVGIQQCFSPSPYLQTVSPPGYIPIDQSGSDAILNAPDPLFFNGGTAKYAHPLSSMNVTTTPLKVSFENLSLEPTHSSSQHIQLAGILPEGAGVNAMPRKIVSPYGDMASANGSQVRQLTEQSSVGGVPSVHNSLKVTLPANNGFINPMSNIHGWAPGDRMRPRIPYGGLPNRIAGEQNMGPRLNKPKDSLTTPIAVTASTAKVGTVNVDGNINVSADQYNRDDFPVDYPDAKFFVIKSYSEDDVHKSIKYNVWSSTSSGNKKLDIAYEEARRSSVGKPRKCPVFLFFSVNASGHFCGVAEMIGPVDFHKDMDFWLQDKWTGSFPVKWHIIKDIPNSSFRHIILVNNEYRPVTSSRDTQEVHFLPGMNMLTIFKNSPLKTSILDDFIYYEKRQRIVQGEKSLLLGRKTYETAAASLIPVPSNRPRVTVSQPSKADEQQVKSSVINPPVDNGKEPNVKVDNPRESDRRKKISHTVGQDLKADDVHMADGSSQPRSHGGQPNGALGQPRSHGEQPTGASHGGKPNGTVSQPSNLNVHFTADGDIQSESDGRQIKHRAKKQSFEAKSNLSKNLSVPKNTGESAPSNSRAVSGDAKTVDSQERGRPESAGGPNGQNSGVGVGSLSGSSKVDEIDVLTVGSMEIEITESNRSITGTLTIGTC